MVVFSKHFNSDKVIFIILVFSSWFIISHPGTLTGTLCDAVGHAPTINPKKSNIAPETTIKRFNPGSLEKKLFGCDVKKLFYLPSTALNYRVFHYSQ